MRILQHASKSFSDELAAFCRSAAAPREIAEAVTSILADAFVYVVVDEGDSTKNGAIIATTSSVIVEIP